MDVNEIDAELKSITENQVKLTRSAAARKDEITSLQTRYPEIVLTPASSVNDIYHALYLVRVGRAAKIKPIAHAKLRASNQRFCDSLRDLTASWEKLQTDDGYKRLGLDDRLTLRKALDDTIASKPPSLNCDDYPPPK